MKKPEYEECTCLRCGECCYTYDVIIPAAETGTATIMKPGGRECPWMTRDEEGITSCKLHNTGRKPLECQLFKMPNEAGICRIGAAMRRK